MWIIDRIRKYYTDSEWIEHKDREFSDKVEEIKSCINAENPKLRNKNNKNIGPSYIVTKDNISRRVQISCGYSEKISELTAFTVVFSTMTKKLLIEKGFTTDNSEDSIQERIALLHTEVSELVDAEKKGKDTYERTSEIADIIIRLMNIPVIFPNILDKIKTMLKDEKIVEVTIGREYDIEYIKDLDSEETSKSLTKFLKLRILNEIHQMISEISRYLYIIKKSKNKDSYDEYNDIMMDYVIKDIFSIILFCNLYIYISNDIEGNLHDFVKIKMNENFKRPYRFNVSENF